MIHNDIQPWGYAPTPLIPRSIAENFGYLDVPEEIKGILGKDATIADIYESLWEYVDSVSSECKTEIIETLRPIFSSIMLLRIYTDESLTQPIKSLPFSFSTKEIIRDFPVSFTKSQLRFGDLIYLRIFGVHPAVEFACLVEAATKSQMRYGQNYTEISRTEVEDFLVFSKIRPFFQNLSDWALQEQGLVSLTSALPEPKPEWPLKIKKKWSELGNIEPRYLSDQEFKDDHVSKLIVQRLEKFDERLFAISLTRVLVPKNMATLEELASSFGVTRERIRQLEEKVLSILEKFKGGVNQPVLRKADIIRDKLGSAVQDNHPLVEKALNWVVDDLEELYFYTKFENLLLLWLAGPYKIHESWLLRDLNLPKKTIEALNNCRDHRGFISQQEVHKILNNLGIRHEYHNPWLKHLGKFVQVEGGLIYFQGTVLDKAYTLLKYFDRPFTVEQMLEYLGNVSVVSTRQRLIKDPRFLKINAKNEFVLAETEGYDEYTSIYNGIIQELKLQGGQATVSHLVDKLSSKFRVNEGSIRGILGTPKFKKDKFGFVSIRDDEDCLPIVTDITKTAACYLSEQEKWCLRVKVDRDSLRGSGRTIPNSFSQILGCDIGKKVEVPTELGIITLSWPLAAPMGAYAGSLKKVLDHFSAEIGDYLFIKATTPKVTFSILKQKTLEIVEPDLVKLALLLGACPDINEEIAIYEIAKALGINLDSKNAILAEANLMLLSRGEEDLARLIPKSKRSIDDYIKDMERLF